MIAELRIGFVVIAELSIAGYCCEGLKSNNGMDRMRHPMAPSTARYEPQVKTDASDGAGEQRCIVSQASKPTNMVRINCIQIMSTVQTINAS